MHEAKTNLSRLVERAEAGEEIVLTRRGRPTVRLAPVKRRSSMAQARGALSGPFWMSDDFDELPDDVAEAFGMR